MTLPVRAICPIHLFSRQQCSWTCKWARAELKKLGNDYRQYWFDRRHGKKPMSLLEYQLRYGMIEQVYSEVE
jgi:hypothetical protein